MRILFPPSPSLTGFFFFFFSLYFFLLSLQDEILSVQTERKKGKEKKKERRESLSVGVQHKTQGIYINHTTRTNTMLSQIPRSAIHPEVEVEKDKHLVVATSHLESPCPGPPTCDQMFSKKRVEQAKEAVNFLKKNQNVIFCGDMNWDDKLGGKFPLDDRWVDASEELKPGEDGRTYDTKSNKMLTGNRKQQKRIDRFLCSLHDLRSWSSLLAFDNL